MRDRPAWGPLSAGRVAATGGSPSAPVQPAAVERAPTLRAIPATDLVALLDAAGIRRAVTLSVAYQLGNPNRPAVENEYGEVRAENDWTARQVAGFPDRLRGFYGVNPLKDYALEEIGRCAKDAQLRFGLKLHFGNSDVDLENPTTPTVDVLHKSE